MDKDQVSIDQLLQRADSIESELKQINQHRLVKVYDSFWAFVGFQLLKGIAFGLGTVLGATIVVSGIAYTLSQMEFIPVIGEWVHQIVEVIESYERR